MRLLFLFFLLPFLFSPAFGQDTGPILVIGDSMLTGDFGRDLHQILRAKTGREVYSLGFGGASSSDYVQPQMKNTCCGYVLRHSDTNSAINIEESSGRKSDEVIGKKYNGSLAAMVSGIAPKTVIIVLGTNRLNAHPQLIQLLRQSRPGVEIIWIGPPKLSTSDAIYFRLLKDISGISPPVKIIRSDQMNGIGDPKETMWHPGGTIAQSWADQVWEKLQSN